MNKRIRSRVLAAGVASSAFIGLGAFPFLQSAAFAQDKPTAAEQLDRGSRLFDQKQYAEAKKVLLDIEPGQLPEDQRGKLTDLLKNTDVELAKARGANGGFDAAQANLDGDKLAAAATGFQGVIDDPTAAADLKDKAKIQLALVKEKQTAKAPQMKELLAQAQSLYDAGKLDEAQNAVDTVVASGSDLGWQDNAKPAQLQQKIADKRTAMAAAPAPGGAMAPMAAATAPTTDMAATPGATPTTDAAPMASTTPAPDMTPPAAAMTPAAPAPMEPMAPAPGPSGVDPNSALGQTIAADQIEHERANTLYKIAMKKSSDALTANPPQYSVAIDRAHEAATIIDDNRRYFSDAEANALRDAAARQEQVATANKGTYDVENQKREQTSALAAEKVLVERRLTEKRRRVDGLVRDAQRFIDTQQYKEGADTLRQVLIIDPTNSSAKLMLTLVTDRITYRQYQKLVNQASREDQKIENQTEETLVPYADLLIYPENWIDITRSRLGAQSDQDSPANRTARARLAENLKEITADQLGLERVINFLRDNTGTNIFVNWKALEAAGIDRNTPVSVNLHDAPFSKVLTTVLASVGGTANLAYTVDDGVITISTRDDLTSTVPPRIATYDIRDLLIQPDNAIPPSLDITQSLQQASATGGGGGGSNIFTQTQGNTAVTPQAARDDIVKKITDAITSTVDPNSWRTAGGSIGSIQEISGELLINQTVDNHVAIESLLDKIRETHAVQIAIEARIMFVNNNFFEQFGVNWSLAIPAGSLGGNVGAITASGGTLSAVNALTNSGTLSGAVAGSPGISVSGSVLDNFQLNLLLEATQADQRTVNVSAPRLTLFNGQQGFIQVVRVNGYISNFNQSTTGGTIGVAPTVSTTLTTSTLRTGVGLTVQAAVSADRRYVVMQVTPELSTNDGFTQVGALGSSNANNTLNGIFLQLPNVEVTTVHSTVSIPDGGTLLIGGEKVVSTSDVEVGVPILSKIPGINRLFTNRSQEKDERTLLVLVRPKIIIQREIENNLFGPGYDRPTGLPTNATNQAVLDGNGTDPTFKVVGHD